MRSATRSDSVSNRFGQAVIGQDLVDIIIQRLRLRAHLDHDVELDALGGAAFLLKGANLNLDHMIAQGNAVARISTGRCDRTFLGMREGEADITGHVGPFPDRRMRSWHRV